MTALLAVLNLPAVYSGPVSMRRIIELLPPLQLLLMDILTAYQRPSRLEISLQALMPTPVQLSTVGQPFFQGNLKLHVIEGAVLAGGPTVAFVFNDDNDHFYMHMCIYKEIHTCHLRPLYIFSFLCHNWTTDGALSSLLLTSLVSNSSKGHLL